MFYSQVIKKGLLGVGLIASLAACDNEAQMATVQVQLIDAPADYEAVFIDVVDVQVNVGEEEDGWQSLDEANMGVYNLLELTNGASVLLGEIALPAGELSQVRLILGDNNSLVTDGQTVALSTPSAQQSGLKLAVNQELEAGITYQLVIDFDAARSIVESGNSGDYNLKPVIRASMDPRTGAISGVIEQGVSEGVNATVFAIVGEDTLTSAYTDDTGNFLLGALPEDTYTVSISPETGSGYIATDVENVSVTIGEVNELGTITLNNE